MKRITLMLMLLLCIPMAMMSQIQRDADLHSTSQMPSNIETPTAVDVPALISDLNSRSASTVFDDDQLTPRERRAVSQYYREAQPITSSRMPTTITTLFAQNNGGSLGGAVYFDVTVGASDITITDMEINTGEAGAFTMDVYAFAGTYVGNEANAGAWGAPLATASGMGMGQDVPSPASLDVPIVLSANTTYAMALVLDASHGHDYTNGDGTNEQYSNADLTIDLGSASNAPFTAPTFNPRVWNGSITYDLGGGGGPGNDVVYAYDGGFCSDDFGTFDINGPYTLATILVTANPAWFAGDFDGSGTLYVLDQGTLSLLTVDTGTGADTTVGPLTNLAAGHTVTGLAWNANDSTMYALSTDGAVSTVYSVDLGTGTLTVIGNTGTTLGIWLAIDSMGNAFAADLDDNLYSIDLGTGAGTVVGPLGFNINFAQDADFDPDTDVLYAGLYLGGGANEWATIDTTTGAATSLGTVNAGCAELSVVAIEGTFIDNDDCANATAIACDDTLSGDTSDGNTDTNGDGAPDEWFAFTSTAGTTEVVTVSTCNQAGYDTILTVYDSCGGMIIAQNDDGPGCSGFTSELSFAADGSSTYYIAVDGFGGASGTFDLSITCALPPANDDCDGAIAIECGVPIFGTTINSTDDSAVAPDCDTPTTTEGVWYVYEDTTGLVTDILVSTCSANTDYDTKISVYTGDCANPPLTCVAGNDDSPNCTNFQSEVEFQSDGNTTYYIFVHGFGGQTGNFELNMTCTPVPPPNDMIVNSIDVDEIGVPYVDPSVAMPAATLENGSPTGCDISGGLGVWYNFTSAGNGTATAEIVSPAGNSFVVFFTAPNEMAIETDLEYFFQIGNQCAPGTVANINTAAGQVYYVYVVNDGGITDITIDGTLLSTNDNVIEGFSFHPNPTTGSLNLDSINTIEDVAIYNLLGQQVLGQTVDATSAQLDTSSLATGAYLMKVTVDGQTGTYKVIKR